MTVLVALIWVSFFSMNDFPKWLDFKPFNCVVCLSFWSAMIMYLIRYYLPTYSPFIDSLCIGGAAAYLSMIAKRILFKI